MPEWHQSSCRPDVWHMTYPDQGWYFWTPQYGTQWVGLSSTGNTYAAWGWECGALGPPKGPYSYLSWLGAAGQEFEGGVIYWRAGRWQVLIYSSSPDRVAADDEAPPTEPDPPAKPKAPPPASRQPKPKESS